jgi:hypothetical protein
MVAAANCHLEMVVRQFTPDEPLSPELVLVLPPEIRAEILANLGPPTWPRPRLRMAAPPARVREPFTRSLGTLVVARTIQLGVIFAAVAILTLAMSLVAHAFR